MLRALALWVAVAPAIARADEPPTAGAGEIEGPMRPEAQALYDRGLQRFQSHDYANATADFEAGFAIEPRREFLFAEAQARRLAGDCKAAVALYQRFLTTGPPALQMNATHIALGRCAQLLADHPDVVVVTPPPPKPEPPPPLRWWRDPFGLAAAGAGVVGIGVGVGFLMASGSAQNGANASPTYPEYESGWSTAQRRQIIGVAALVAGGTLAAAAAVRFVLVRRKASRRDTVFVVSLSLGAGALGGSF
jgi:hypothetical protein